jgi:Uri superfamily endonuclease
MYVFLPGDPGTYALQLHLANPIEREIGKLGRISFPAGEYIYIGSAFGPGGLRARLGRHLHLLKKPHWHIDYLLPPAQPVGFWAITLSAHLECIWVTALMTLPGAYFPARELGSSDCRNGCPAHLLAFSRFDLHLITNRLGQTTSEFARQADIQNCQVIRTALPAQ